jgi:hypothetical protein
MVDTSQSMAWTLRFSLAKQMAKPALADPGASVLPHEAGDGRQRLGGAKSL